MLPNVMIAGTKTPDGSRRIELYRHGTNWQIRVDDEELMGSRSHSTEDALGTLGCTPLAGREKIHVLIGGLGLGFSLRAALDVLPADARVTVAELVPEVVDWNRQFVGDVAGRPLDDPRVTVAVADVYALIRSGVAAYDAILLDVDNGPAAFTVEANGAMYGAAGIATCARALRPGGILGVWSVDRDRRYEKRLATGGFAVTAHDLRGHKGKGSIHYVWIAKLGAGGGKPAHGRPTARPGRDGAPTGSRKPRR